jgi:hypothetical protein
MTPEELAERTTAYQAAAVILAANATGVLAALCARSEASEALADRLGLDRRAVATVADALVCLGVLEREGRLLCVPGTLRPLLDPSSPASRTHSMAHQWHLFQRWGRLDSVLATGRPVPRPPEDEDRLRAFILGMADMARGGARALWDAADLSRASHLVDVGGGPGELALAALERFPDLEATVFDRPEVLAIAREYASTRRVKARLGYRAGDALADDIPPCDAALVSSLLHSYGPGGVQAIAAHVAAGVRPGGVVLIREFMWDDDAHSGPLSAALFAVNMLGGTADGRCWSAAEIEGIFGRAGFARWRSARLDPRTTLLIGSKGA